MSYNLEHSGLLLFALPVVSFLYSSVGHGGASGYLALMTLFSFTPEVMRATALLLNLFVAGIAFYHYNKEGHFNKKLFLYFAVASIPMSFWGGSISIDASIYKKILAVLLIFATLKIINPFVREISITKEIKIWTGLLVGGIIGFFSGLIGIGGGIILSPVILLMHWGKVKETAAVSALFILVNSISGLAGQFSNGIAIPSQIFVLVAVAAMGGFLGSYYGSKKCNSRQLRMLLATVLVLASFKLFIM